MAHVVRCPTCHREERWSADAGGPKVVWTPGGSRRPAEHPSLAAWRILRRARDRQSGPVVAVCEGCGQPMVGEGTALPALTSWTLQTPAGPLTVDPSARGDGGLQGPAGALTAEAAEAWLVEQVGERFRVSDYTNPRAVFQGVFLVVLGVILGVIFLIWLGAATFLSQFLYGMFEISKTAFG